MCDPLGLFVGFDFANVILKSLSSFGLDHRFLEKVYCDRVIHNVERLRKVNENTTTVLLFIPVMVQFF